MSPMEVIKKLFNETFYLNAEGDFVRSQDGSAMYELEDEVVKAIKHLLSLEHDEKPV